jgi:beta-glucosidase
VSGDRNRSNVQGYLVWSLMVVFEILSAFCFGIYGVDRWARHSARWCAGFLHSGELKPAPAPLSISAYSAI